MIARAIGPHPPFGHPPSGRGSKKTCLPLPSPLGRGAGGEGFAAISIAHSASSSELQINRPTANLLKNHFISILGTLFLLLTQSIPILFCAPAIRVTSKDRENHPIARAEVQLKVMDKAIETRFTSANGVAEFSGIPAGIYNIVIWKDGYHEVRQMQVTISPGA